MKAWHKALHPMIVGALMAVALAVAFLALAVVRRHVTLQSVRAQ